MKKIFGGIVFAVMVVGSSALFAQNKSVEVGVFGQSVSVKSSPVSGFDAKGNAGLDVKVVISPPTSSGTGGFDVVLGASSQSADIKLAGTALGKIDSETLLGGVRYRFTNGEYFQPYVGAGIHYTWMEGNLANNTARIVEKKNGLGETVELGVQIPLKTSFVDSVGFGVQHYFNPKQVMVTNAGAKISDLNLDSTRYTFSVGKKF